MLSFLIQKRTLLVGVLCLSIWMIGILVGLQQNTQSASAKASLHHLRPIEVEPLSKLLLPLVVEDAPLQLPIAPPEPDHLRPEPPNQFVATAAPKPKQISLISRNSGVTAICDRRGNLGPCGVVVQDVPGSDWLKDRWQAASDMGGTAIPGAHWVLLDFHRPVKARSFVLDWETAYAEDYRLEGRMNISDFNNVDKYRWDVIYDNAVPAHRQRYCITKQ